MHGASHTTLSVTDSQGCHIMQPCPELGDNLSARQWPAISSKSVYHDCPVLLYNQESTDRLTLLGIIQSNLTVNPYVHVVDVGRDAAPEWRCEVLFCDDSSRFESLNQLTERHTELAARRQQLQAHLEAANRVPPLHQPHATCSKCFCLQNHATAVKQSCLHSAAAMSVLRTNNTP